jgi:sugar phosphate isomerase/epimerase
MIRIALCSIGFQTRDRYAPAPRLQRSLAAIASDAAHWGFAGIEVWERHLSSASDAECLQAAATLRRFGLGTPMLSSYYNFTRHDRSCAESLAHGHQVLTRAAAWSIPQIRIFTGNTRSRDATPAQWRRARLALRELCDRAAGHGIRLAVETHDWNLSDRLDGCLRLVDEVARDNLGFIFQPDTFGCLWPYAYKRLRARIFHVHANLRAPDPARDPIDWRNLAARQRQDGWQGWWSLEWLSPGVERIAPVWGPWLRRLCDVAYR